MAVVPRGTHTASNNSGTSVVLDLSNAGAVAGDFAIIVFQANENTATVSVNRSGWSEVGSQFISTTVSANAFWKVLTAADITDDTVTVSQSAAATRIAGGLIVLSGVNGSNPLDPVGTNPTQASDTTGDANPEFPAIDPTNSAYVLAVLAQNGGGSLTGFTQTTGWTERFDAVTTATGGTREAAVYCQTFNSSPTSSNVAAGTATAVGDTVFGFGWTFALAPSELPPLVMAPHRY